ncbi:hypothetical protein ALC57_02911 [Trachymyrmex cornetzi]|uniref:Uncharacterized protein n=1 Tax=Trachymyrmex cornetzi TaxID=471704 RepID=A0A195EI64_9HYME|nr:hypothetical protein ALC57_02911 [Trachymyrmex cornetzi]
MFVCDSSFLVVLIWTQRALNSIRNTGDAKRHYESKLDCCPERKLSKSNVKSLNETSSRKVIQNLRVIELKIVIKNQSRKCVERCDVRYDEDNGVKKLPSLGGNGEVGLNGRKAAAADVVLLTFG